jgi:chromosome segregation ATPase
MPRNFDFLPRIAIFIAGIATGAITGARRLRGEIDPKLADALKQSLSDLESRMVGQHSVTEARFDRVEARLTDHDAKFKEVPSTADIVSAMEQLLAKTMSSLDERMNSQAGSIEVLKTTVTQTDSLLERVLESLDSLQGTSDSSAQSAAAAEEKQAIGKMFSALEDRIASQSKDFDVLKTTVAKAADEKQAFQKMFASIENRFAAQTKDFESLKTSVSQKEDALARVLASLDQRVGSQSRSLDALKATVSQTDSLLERVLESLDSMQSFHESGSLAEDALLQARPQ